LKNEFAPLDSMTIYPKPAMHFSTYQWLVKRNAYKLYICLAHSISSPVHDAREHPLSIINSIKNGHHMANLAT